MLVRDTLAESGAPIRSTERRPTREAWSESGSEALSRERSSSSVCSVHSVAARREDLLERLRAMDPADACPCLVCLNNDQKRLAGIGCAGFVCLWIVIILITIFASIRRLGPDDQLLIEGPQGKYTIDGPKDVLTHPFRSKTDRKAIRISEQHYHVIKNARSGLLRHEAGPQRVFLGAWDEDQGVKGKVTLQQREYMRLVDSLTGYERIVKGPNRFVPLPLEEAPNGTETGYTISAGKSVLTLNKTSGLRQLHITEGLFIPGPYEHILEKRSPIVIGPMEYVTLHDRRDGSLTNVAGAKQLQLGAYQSMEGSKKNMLVLDKETYVRLVDGLTGVERVVKGPQTMMPKPLEYSKTQPMFKKAVHVSATRAVITWKATNGRKSLVTTEGVFVPGEYEEVLETRPATIIGPKEYAVILDTETGEKRHIAGSKQFFVGAYEELLAIKPKIALQQGFYTRLVNEKTGIERVLKGPLTDVPDANEVAPDGEQRAIFVDTETALIVLDRSTGTKTMVRETGAFIPAQYETIVDTRKLIKVLPSEAMVIRDNQGRLTVKQGGGSADDAAFFLGPYEEILTMQWSAFTPENADGLSQQKVDVQRIDMRVRTIFFKYKVRTSDNVILSLEGTLRWIVKDVDNLLSTTSDPEGDIWYRCRSALIQGVSKTTFQDFFMYFNTITNQAFNSTWGDEFYNDRGVEVKSFELTRYECVDPQVDAIRQEIIKETTNRINRRQEAESEVEVKLSQLAGELDIEQNRNDLLQAQGQNIILEARMQGEAYGREELETVKTFIDLLNGSVSTVDERVEIFKMNEQLKGRTQDIQNLKNGNMKLLMAPTSVNLGMYSYN
eukprot:TRINITY_DN29448_c0_g1_i1.p1 TRINITY_DN29448_c0_g1~~TRINITY_DN29448_c0_g1_i1.p1  ORF type:complete len:838 (+),score=242.94 TRINITY_DN29448_c0_g1_i1:47-2560(+)